MPFCACIRCSQYFGHSLDIQNQNPVVPTPTTFIDLHRPSSTFIDLHGLVSSEAPMLLHAAIALSSPVPVAFAAPRKWRGPRSAIPTSLKKLKRSHGSCSVSLSRTDPSKVDVLSCDTILQLKGHDSYPIMRLH